MFVDAIPLGQKCLTPFLLQLKMTLKEDISCRTIETCRNAKVRCRFDLFIKCSYKWLNLLFYHANANIAL